MADEEVSVRKKQCVNCWPCLQQGDDRKAVKKCVHCDFSYCEDCLGRHESLFRSHFVKDIHVDSEIVQEDGVLLRELCPDHTNLADLYCKDHDTIGCSTCMAENHSSCQHVVHIPKVAGELLQSVETETITGQSSDTIKNLESIKLDQQAKQSSLDDSRKNCLDDVDDHRADLLNLVEKLVQVSKDDIEKRYKTFTTGLQRHSQKVKRCLSDLKAARDRLDCCHDNDAQRFVELKKIQKSVDSTAKVARAAKKNMRIKGFDTSIDNSLENMFTKVKSLATTIEPIRIKRKKVIDMSDKADKNTCYIRGTCVLNDGSVLLADSGQKSIKRLSNKTLSIKDQCSLELDPCGVCCINEDEAVVTQRYSLLIVSLKPCLKPTRTLTMTHFCKYVAYSNSELFVTDCDKTLFVYNMQGTLLRTVTSDPSGHDLFSDCKYITCSESGDKVYVADKFKGLITLDRQGSVLDTHLYSEVDVTRGVCPDGSGGLFICGWRSNNVVHLGRRGNVLSEVVSESDGLVRAESLSYDCQNKRLYVSQSFCKNLLVFDL